MQLGRGRLRILATAEEFADGRKQIFRFGLSLQQPPVYLAHGFVQNRTIAGQHKDRYWGVNALQLFGYVEAVYIRHPVIEYDEIKMLSGKTANPFFA